MKQNNVFVPSYSLPLVKLLIGSKLSAPFSSLNDFFFLQVSNKTNWNHNKFITAILYDNLCVESNAKQSAGYFPLRGSRFNKFGTPRIFSGIYSRDCGHLDRLLPFYRLLKVYFFVSSGFEMEVCSSVADLDPDPVGSGLFGSPGSGSGKKI